jgi:hypothetical protein
MITPEVSEAGNWINESNRLCILHALEKYQISPVHAPLSTRCGFLLFRIPASHPAGMHVAVRTAGARGLVYA